MKRYTLLLLLPLAVLAFARPALPTARETYMSIKGMKQGQFKGGTSPREKDGWFKVISVDMQHEVPYDASSGRAEGKREHQPIVIVKEVDAASPKLFEASSRSETLSSVQLQTVEANEKVVETIELSNARIVGIRRENGPRNIQQESITLAYERITIRR